MMQKKQYEAIAREIRIAHKGCRYARPAAYAVEQLAIGLADALEQVSGDPTFDRSRFLKLCGVEE